MVQFAICPQCDNPIQIVGLYKKLKNTDKPYGKHYTRSVNGLADYNQQAYDYSTYNDWCGLDYNQPKKIKEVTDQIVNIILKNKMTIREVCSLQDSVQDRLKCYIGNAELNRNTEVRMEEDREKIIDARRKEIEQGQQKENLNELPDVSEESDESQYEYEDPEEIFVIKKHNL